MSNDNQRQEGATDPDLSRHAATSDDSDYSLSIEEALDRYEAAGLPRTTRSVQRYCAKGDLDAHRVETPFGEKFLITPASVDRHIAYINEVRLVATSRDLPRHAATDVAPENADVEPEPIVATTDDEPRQPTTTAPVSQPVAAPEEMMSRYVAHLEGENAYLRDQNTAKDGQIKDLTERARETNHLIGGLQKMLTPLLGRGGASRAYDYPIEEAETDHPGYGQRRPEHRPLHAGTGKGRVLEDRPPGAGQVEPLRDEHDPQGCGMTRSAKLALPEMPKMPI